MLLRFSFQNFRSYRDEAVLDFQAGPLKEFPETLISGGDDEKMILPVAAIYGPNGGGKSNVIAALSCLVQTVMAPVAAAKSEENKEGVQLRCEPFAFDETAKESPTRFEVFFRLDGYDFQYLLSIFQNNIAEESLSQRKVGGKKPTKIFERNISGITLGTSLKKKNVNVEINSKIPYLSFLEINYNIDEIKAVVTWLKSCAVLDYTNPTTGKRVYIPKDSKEQKKIISMMNQVGVDISDFHVILNEDGQYKKTLAQHKYNGRTYELSVQEESAGTRKLLSIFPFATTVLARGGLLAVDELDARLHPKLLKYIIMLFKNKETNANGAQLLFTTHDMTTMRNDVFRRDEIWFAARDGEGASDLYCLYEIRTEDESKVKATAAYDKQYLEGRYGADPYLQTMLTWEGTKET